MKAFLIFIGFFAIAKVALSYLNIRLHTKVIDLDKEMGFVTAEHLRVLFYLALGVWACSLM